MHIVKQIIAKQQDKGTWSSITFGRYLPKGRARLSAIIQPHCLKPHRLLNSELFKWHWMRKVFSSSITLVTDPFTGFLATGGCGFPGCPCFGKVGRVPLHSYAWDVGGLWFMVLITIVNGVYKLIHNWGAPHCRIRNIWGDRNTQE